MTLRWKAGILVAGLGAVSGFGYRLMGVDTGGIWVLASIGIFIYRKWHVEEAWWKKLLKAMAIYFLTVPPLQIIPVFVPARSSLVNVWPIHQYLINPPTAVHVLHFALAIYLASIPSLGPVKQRPIGIARL